MCLEKRGGGAELAAPRNSDVLKRNKIWGLSCDVPLHVPTRKIALILRFPAHLVGLLGPFGTSSSVSSRPTAGQFLRIEKKRGEKLVHFFDDLGETAGRFREPRPL